MIRLKPPYNDKLMMLRETSRKEAVIEKTKENNLEGQSKNSILEILDESVMELVLEALSTIWKYKEISFRIKDSFIANAVIISLIIAEKIMRENSKIHKISANIEPIQKKVGSQSKIETILRKTK